MKPLPVPGATPRLQAALERALPRPGDARHARAVARASREGGAATTTACCPLA